MRRERHKVNPTKETKAAAVNAAYNDMMGAPQDVAEHPTRSLPAPSGGDFRGAPAYQNTLQPFSDQTDPFNIGA